MCTQASKLYRSTPAGLTGVCFKWICHASPTNPKKKMRAALLVAATLRRHFSFTCGVPINITVDDWLPNHNTDEQLTLTSAWKVGQDCHSCWARPDPAMAYRGTLEVLLKDSTVGSALYVYGIQCHIPGCNADMSFSSTDNPIGTTCILPVAMDQRDLRMVSYCLPSTPSRSNHILFGLRTGVQVAISPWCSWTISFTRRKIIALILCLLLLIPSTQRLWPLIENSPTHRHPYIANASRIDSSEFSLLYSDA